MLICIPWADQRALSLEILKKVNEQWVCLKEKQVDLHTEGGWQLPLTQLPQVLLPSKHVRQTPSQQCTSVQLNVLKRNSGLRKLNIPFCPLQPVLLSLSVCICVMEVMVTSVHFLNWISC